MSRARAADTASSLALLAALLAGWWIASQLGWINRAFLPSPNHALETLIQGLTSGYLLSYSLSTLGRMLVGWLLASLLGIVLGALIGSSASARVWLQPSLEFLRPLPASALMPLAIAVFGLSSGMILMVVSTGAMWPVLLATIHGVRSVHPRLREVSTALQLGKGEELVKIGLPNALPDVLAGMRLALTVSLIVSVVGEMVASQPGLGQVILLAARSFDSAQLFAGVILLGFIGFVSNAGLAIAERRLIRWQA